MSIVSEMKKGVAKKKTEHGEVNAASSILIRHGYFGTPEKETRKQDGMVIRLYTWYDTPEGDLTLVTGPGVEGELVVLNGPGVYETNPKLPVGSKVEINGSAHSGAEGIVIDHDVASGSGAPVVIVELTKAARHKLYGGVGDQIAVRPKFVDPLGYLRGEVRNPVGQPLSGRRPKDADTIEYIEYRPRLADGSRPRVRVPVPSGLVEACNTCHDGRMVLRGDQPSKEAKSRLRAKQRAQREEEKADRAAKRAEAARKRAAAAKKRAAPKKKKAEIVKVVWPLNKNQTLAQYVTEYKLSLAPDHYRGPQELKTEVGQTVKLTQSKYDEFIQDFLGVDSQGPGDLKRRFGITISGGSSEEIPHFAAKVTASGRPTLYIDPQGHDYARYVGLTKAAFDKLVREADAAADRAADHAGIQDRADKRAAAAKKKAKKEPGQTIGYLRAREVIEIPKLMEARELAQSKGKAPFRAPHHTSNIEGIKDELDRAQGGMLYLDQLEEFPGRVIENLNESLRHYPYALIAWRRGPDTASDNRYLIKNLEALGVATAKKKAAPKKKKKTVASARRKAAAAKPSAQENQEAIMAAIRAAIGGMDARL